MISLSCQTNFRKRWWPSVLVVGRKPGLPGFVTVSAPLPQFYLSLLIFSVTYSSSGFWKINKNIIIVRKHYCVKTIIRILCGLSGLFPTWIESLSCPLKQKSLPPARGRFAQLRCQMMARHNSMITYLNCSWAQKHNFIRQGLCWHLLAAFDRSTYQRRKHRFAARVGTSWTCLPSSVVAENTDAIF